MERLLKKVESESEVHYSEQQRAAIRSAAGTGVLLITGGPGTGKTTIVNGILSLLGHMQLKCVLAAPTGRAAKRLTEMVVDLLDFTRIQDGIHFVAPGKVKLMWHADGDVKSYHVAILEALGHKLHPVVAAGYCSSHGEEQCIVLRRLDADVEGLLGGYVYAFVAAHTRKTHIGVVVAYALQLLVVLYVAADVYDHYLEVLILLRQKRWKLFGKETLALASDGHYDRYRRLLVYLFSAACKAEIVDAVIGYGIVV